MKTSLKGAYELLSIALLATSLAMEVGTNARTLQIDGFSLSLSELQPASPPPDFGTFWRTADYLQWGADAPPYPGNPYSPEQFQVYSFGVEGIFLVDDAGLMTSDEFNRNDVMIPDSEEEGEGDTEGSETNAPPIIWPVSLEGLQLVDPTNVPESGTFYLYQDQFGTNQPDPPSPPPYPWVPEFAQSAPVYALNTNEQYLIDDTGLARPDSQPQSEYTLPSYSPGTLYLELTNLSDGLATLVIHGVVPGSSYEILSCRSPAGGNWNAERVIVADQETTTVTLSVPNWGNSLFFWAHRQDDLWLEITVYSNATALFLIHNAETNGGYDLYGTDNLSDTNWFWILRTDPGETNPVVTYLFPDQGYFRLARTNDTDGDGLTDAFERLVSHTDPNNRDENSNGIPDGWEWSYFGSLQPANGDYDGDGVNNGMEYTNGTDPNKIRFSLVTTNHYINADSVWLQFNIQGGVPSSLALLVSDTNFDDAVWQPYQTNSVQVPINSGDGDYDVWVGLRGRLTNSYQTWRGTIVSRDTVPPAIVITNPVGGFVSRRISQLQGYIPEPLSSLTYDLTNAAGSVTNQPGFITGVVADTNAWKFSTNYFQCYDLMLTNGFNGFTLRATDLAGNTSTTNLTLTVDTASNTNPPTVTLIWPQNNGKVVGTNFALQGTINDDTARVAVSSGTNTFSGVVARGGRFSVQNVPLPNATNVFTITATNDAGYSSSQALTVIKSSVSVSMNSLSDDQLTQPFVAVTGTLSGGVRDIWVNGVQASVNEDGTWQADNVPVNDQNGSGEIGISVYPPRKRHEQHVARRYDHNTGYHVVSNSPGGLC